MKDNQISYDDVCRHVGHLYLTNQQAFDRQDASYGVRIKQLEEELANERKRRIELERAAAQVGK